MDDNNFFTVQAWMVTKLKLSGNELMVYAIIYGFSQDGESSFKGSINYLCKWLSISRPTVIKALKELVKSGDIIKETKTINNIIFNRYTASLQVVKKLYRGSKETLLGGSKETLPYNIVKDNIDNNIVIKEKNIKKRKSKRTTIPKSKIPAFYFKYKFFKDEFPKIWFNEFIPTKKKKGAVITDTILERQLKKISQLSNDDYSVALEILEKTVNSGWSDFFPLKQNFKNDKINKPKKNEFNTGAKIYL